MLIIIAWAVVIAVALLFVARAGKRTQSHKEMPAGDPVQVWGPLGHEPNCRCNTCR